MKSNTSMIQSTAKHVKFRGKQGGPPPKAKYYLVTDRVIVLWRKGEKNPGRGVKENLKPYAYKQREHTSVCDRVLFVERSGELMC